MAVARGALFSVSAWGSLGKKLTYRREQRFKPARGLVDRPGSGGMQAVGTGRVIVTRYTPTAPLVPFTTPPNVPPSGALGQQEAAAQIPRTSRNRRLFKFVTDMLREHLGQIWEINGRWNSSDPRDNFYRWSSANIRRPSIDIPRRNIRADINTGYFYLGSQSVQRWAFKRLAGNNFGFLWWMSYEWMRLSASDRAEWTRRAEFITQRRVRDTANPFGFDWGPGFQSAWAVEAFLPTTEFGTRRIFYGRKRGELLRTSRRSPWILWVDGNYEPVQRYLRRWQSQFTLAFQFPFLPQ